MYLYGKNPVRERLKAAPESIKKIIIRDNLKDQELISLVSDSGISIESLKREAFLKLNYGDRAQGIMALVDKFEYADFDKLLASSKHDPVTLIFLDNLNDPQNLGVIIRTAACLGGFAVIIPKHESCEVTEAVLHVANGGENHIPVSRVTNLSIALEKAKRYGYWSAGAVVEGGDSIESTGFTFPLCLIMGSEEKGIRPGLLKNIDFKLTLPMRGAGLSLNVAVCTGIFCYEITRQRMKKI
jgi:23S rRNA (guanosine2251-2'-O)-methyltransferase